MVKSSNTFNKTSTSDIRSNNLIVWCIITKFALSLYITLLQLVKQKYLLLFTSSIFNPNYSILPIGGAYCRYIQQKKLNGYF